MTVGVHDTSAKSRTQALWGRWKSKRNELEHCGKKIKKAAMKEGEKLLKKVCGTYFLSGNKKGENGTRSRRGRNKITERQWSYSG